LVAEQFLQVVGQFADRVGDVSSKPRDSLGNALIHDRVQAGEHDLFKLLDSGADLHRSLIRGQREILHLAGDDGESTSGGARPAGFDGGVEGDHAGLLGHVAYQLDHASEIGDDRANIVHGRLGNAGVPDALDAEFLDQRLAARQLRLGVLDDLHHTSGEPATQILGALWPALADLTPPAPPLSAELAQQVERMFTHWHWWNDGEHKVFTGLWAAGLLGAAISWRPHGLLVGPPGSGKSTLLDLYACLSPLAMSVNDYSAAGVRQMLTGRAAPLILDEADEDPETMGRLQQVLRRASGGEGARVVRGTGEGKAMRSDFMSPAILGSVLAPPLMPQDATRITKMELIRIPDDAAALPIDAMMTWARNNAAALWGRAIEGIPRFRLNLAMIRAALIRLGCSPRPRHDDGGRTFRRRLGQGGCIGRLMVATERRTSGRGWRPEAVPGPVARIRG
jgi:energy-coupling factor transporter ATP-binding protein EcfA2